MLGLRDVLMSLTVPGAVSCASASQSLNLIASCTRPYFCFGEVITNQILFERFGMVSAGYQSAQPTQSESVAYEDEEFLCYCSVAILSWEEG